MSLYSVTESEFDPRDNNWDDWEDPADLELQCLFCSTLYPNAVVLFDHCKADHAFDFVAIRAQLQLDYYQCIRLLNYIREQVHKQPGLMATSPLTVTKDAAFLENDQYLKPVLPNDELLMCFDDVDIPMIQAQQQVQAMALNGFPEPTTDLERQLIHKVHQLQYQLRQAQSAGALLSTQFRDYQEMVKSHFYDTLDDEARSVLSHVTSFSRLSIAHGGEAPSSALRSKPAPRAKKPTDPSDYYFQSYAYNDIHETMLKDTVRTEGYRDFIYDNKDVFKGKVVLDVGCGTGILSMFAARAGATKVFAVDNSDVIDKTHQTIMENQLENVITLIKGKIEEVVLPVDSVDIIISEWMGYFLLFEAMLDSVLVARDRWLLPDGLLCPSYMTILLGGFEDSELINDTFNFWENVYGFKMSAMKQSLDHEALVEVVEANAVITTTSCLKTIDISCVETTALNFTSAFTLKVMADGTLHGLVGYFDTYFARDALMLPPPASPTAIQDAQHAVGRVNPNAPTGDGDQRIHQFTTGPHGPPTHWKQTLFIFDHPLVVTKGQQLQGRFTCRKGVANPRELDISISYALVADASVETGTTPMTTQQFALR
ncbi:hypothetical protein H4R34_004502 [Dimargaris verticillata]|uniref:type I protein arginine methyltransferase n=1 Tax=Dimargaris verticillata TaxID=2761393 RepID=A0A9W8B4S3_9FUNG|nr:hypothetical protein H4R34_004502 [Dimargaris verticillata]